MKKRGQEEILGFVVIVVIISVAILIALSFMLNSSNDEEVVESYEIEGYIQSMLQFTTECEGHLEFLEVTDLIIYCEEGRDCENGLESCEVLEKTLDEVIGESWNVGEESSIKGYNFQLLVNGEETIGIDVGNQTINSKGGFENFARRGNDYYVYLNIYY